VAAADLLNLYQLCGSAGSGADGILAPDQSDTELSALIEQLRRQGERVVVDLTGATVAAREQNCSRQLIQVNGAWAVKEV